MRKIRYAVAMSLDGFIAGPQGEADWIEMKLRLLSCHQSGGGVLSLKDSVQSRTED